MRLLRPFTRKLNSTEGALGLAAIMVGVVSSTVQTTVFEVVPWSQDAAAGQSLRSIQTAQSVHNVKTGGYADASELATAGYLPELAADAYCISTDGATHTAYIKTVLDRRLRPRISLTREDERREHTWNPAGETPQLIARQSFRYLAISLPLIVLTTVLTAVLTGVVLRNFGLW